MAASTSSTFGGTLSKLGRILNQPIGPGAAKAREKAARRAAAQARGPSVGHRQMRRELYTLLEKHAASRQAMRQLDVVERTLRHDGIDAVQALPVKVLAKALDELEALVWDWSAAGLAEIRSRLAVTVKNRRHEASEEQRLADRYSSAPPIEADVSEVSHDLYEEMERSWTGQVPAEVHAALQARNGSN